MTKILDISPILSPRIAVWPGDASFQRSISLSIDKGDNLELSSINTTVHVGAHTDAPNHYVGGGEDIVSRGLERYIGQCQVVFALSTRYTVLNL